MNKYSRGKIYKIVDNTNGNVYYGSTVRTLSWRLTKHKESGNKCMSKYIIENGNYNIILIENYPCESREQLESREAHYITNNECINIMTPGRTHKEWYQENRERILIKMKNKVKTDERKQYEIDYSIKNKDINNEKSKLWYQNNKDKKLEYDRQLRAYRYSWGGHISTVGNLLNIDVNLFL